MNRGVELSAEVIDSPQALIADQVASGLSCGWRSSTSSSPRQAAREPTAGAPPTRTTDGAAGLSAESARRVLDRAGGPAPPADPRRHVLDPRADIDGRHDLLVRDGQIAEIGDAGRARAAEGGEALDGRGPARFPAFVDPHVHLRTPGREDEEDLESGTRAAAAGGFCGMLAMPNTDPVIDDAAVLARAPAARRARGDGSRSASWPRSPAGRSGTELTEMVELAPGAAGFSDDGVPVADAGGCARHSSTSASRGGVLALHEEDPALSAAGRCTRARSRAMLGLTGIPSISESTMIERDAAIAGYEGGRVHVLHLSAAESVPAVERAKAAGVQ